MVKTQDNDEFEKTNQELAFHAVKRACILTLLIYLLYNYQQYMSRLHNNHHAQSFVYLFLLMSVTIFIIERFTPSFANNLMYGIGLGVGSALLNKIITIK